MRRRGFDVDNDTGNTFLKSKLRKVRERREQQHIIQEEQQKQNKAKEIKEKAQQRQKKKTKADLIKEVIHERGRKASQAIIQRKSHKGPGVIYKRPRRDRDSGIGGTPSYYGDEDYDDIDDDQDATPRPRKPRGWRRGPSSATPAKTRSRTHR